MSDWADDKASEMARGGILGQGTVEQRKKAAEVLRSIRAEADARWVEMAQQHFEGVRPWNEMTGGFPDVASFVIHEIWKRDPRVEKVRAEAIEEAAQIAGGVGTTVALAIADRIRVRAQALLDQGVSRG